MELENGRRVRFDGMWQIGSKMGVLEFLECGGVGEKLSSHGLCPECSEKLERMGKVESKTSKKLREKTMQRLEQISLSQNISKIYWEWQCNWLKQKRQNSQIADFCGRFQPWQGCKNEYTPSELVEDILDEKITGFVNCTLSVAKGRRNDLDHFPPFFIKKAVKPMGPLLTYLQNHQMSVPKAEAKVIPSHLACGWHHTSTILFMADLLKNDLKIFNIKAGSFNFNFKFKKKHLFLTDCISNQIGEMLHKIGKRARRNESKFHKSWTASYVCRC